MALLVQKGNFYTAKVEIFDKKNIFDQNVPNATLEITNLDRKIYHDSIYSRVGEVEWRDFNGDSIKDILVQNSSDVRSNWTYFLFLIDPENDTIQLIRGFDEIKNPKMNYDANVVESYVSSGRNYYEFYRIQGDSIVDMNMLVYDNHDDSSYAKYEEAIEELKRSK